MALTVWTIAAIASPGWAQSAGTIPNSRAGLDQMIAQRFPTVDTNHDGAIDRIEAAEALGIVGQKASGQANVPMFGVETGADGRPRFTIDQRAFGSAGGLDMLFDHVDRNHDGLIQLSEVQAAARQRFDAADRNHDGKLSQAEMQQAKGEIQLLQQSLGM
jgi:Ca2+-binding EF-hand superfamily protein